MLSTYVEPQQEVQYQQSPKYFRSRWLDEKDTTVDQRIIENVPLKMEFMSAILRCLIAEC